ncbi:hypothetical protein V8E36_004011 [Tilletia maclaganii]
MGLPRTEYQLYKFDTRQISTWLARAALERGYSLAGFQRAPEEAADIDQDEAEAEDQEHGAAAAADDAEVKKSASQKKNARKNAAKKAKKKAQRQTADEQHVTDEPAKGADLPSANEGGDEATTEAEPPASDDADSTPATEPASSVEPSKDANSTPVPITFESLDGGYVMKASEYVKLARFLVEKGVDIPIELLRIICRCIKLRFNALKRFLPDAQISTASHEHFIDVLRQVGFILQEARTAASLKKRAEKNHSMPAPERPAAETSNRFAALSTLMEDTEPYNEDDIQLPEPKTPSKATRSTARAKFIVQPDKQEVLLDFIAFFADLHELRKYIKGIWPCEEMMKIITPTLGNDLNDVYEYVFTALRRRFNKLQKAGRQVSFDLLGMDTLGFQMFDYFFCAVLVVLEPFMEGLQEHPDMITKADAVYQATTFDVDIDTLSIPERLVETARMLNGTYTLNAATIVLAKEDARPGEPLRTDQTAHSVVENDGKPRLWSLFVAQMWVCIVSTIGDKGLSRARLELLNETKQIAADHQILVDQWRAFAASRAHHSTAQMAMESDPIGAMLKHELRIIDGGFDKLDLEYAIFKLLKRHPVACGIRLYRLRCIHQETARSKADWWNTVLVTAHLHHSCRTLASPDLRERLSWPDMESWKDFVGRENLFAGRVPTNAQDGIVCLAKMLGASLSSLRDLRNDMGEAFKMRTTGSPRGLEGDQVVPKFKDPATLHPLLLEKLEPLDRVSPITISMIEENLQQRLTRAQEEEHKKAGLARKARIAQRRRKATLQELLEEMERALKAEVVSTSFDHGAFHLRCIRILRTIIERFKLHPSKIIAIGGQDLRHSFADWEVIDVGIAIIRQSACAEQDWDLDPEKRLAYKASGRKKPCSEWLQYTAEVLADVLQEPGVANAEQKKMGLEA